MIPRSSIALGGIVGAAILAAALSITPVQAERAPTLMPPPLMPPPLMPTATQASTPTQGLQTAIFAGGCFWGVQAVFQHIDGVTQAVSGYAGGTMPGASYERVSTGATGHTEAVRVTFDPARVSFGTLLRIFFSVALDPTELNRQGPDTGTQYRSALFVDGPEQATVARAYIAQLGTAKIFDRPIVTTVGPMTTGTPDAFYVAEAYHQDYLVHHLNQPYIAHNDVPKVEALKRLFPANWRETPVLVGPTTASR